MYPEPDTAWQTNRLSGVVSMCRTVRDDIGITSSGLRKSKNLFFSKEGGGMLRVRTGPDPV